MSHHAEQQKLLAELIDSVTSSGSSGIDHLDEDYDNNSIVSISNIPPNSIYADPHKFASVVIPLIVHTADLSDPAKDIKLYGQWAKRAVDEFFAQAENEKKLDLPVSSFMDKEQTNLPTIQCGWLKHVIRPWFDLWGRLLQDQKQGPFFQYQTQGPLFQFNVAENLKFMQNELDKLKKSKSQRHNEQKNTRRTKRKRW
eukprot:522897_1